MSAPENSGRDAYRFLASKLHPDHGGDPDAMRALNALNEEAKESRKFRFGKNAQHAADVHFEVDRKPAGGTPADEPAADGEGYVPLILNGVEIPREAAAALRALPKAEYDQWLVDRNACLRDPLALSKCLGYDLVENPHRALFDFLIGKLGPGIPFAELSDIKKKMLLWPRGSGKTFCIRIAEVMFILNYPQIRICFLTGGEILGKRQLASLKNVFKKPTAEFLRLFPEFCLISVQSKKGNWSDEEPSWGNAHEFSVPARGESIMPEPTFAISTARSVKAGSHYDLIVVDDLVNDSNWSSQTLLEKSYQDYLDVTPLLSPSGQIIMTGTRYAPEDCYERVQETAASMAAAGLAPVWAFSIRDCWSTDCTHCKHPAVFHPSTGSLGPCTMQGCTCPDFDSDGVQKCLFPVVIKANGEPFGFTITILNQILAESGKQFFACQYLNKPELSDGPRSFTKELIESVTLDLEQQLPSPSISTTYLILDQAYTGLDAGTKNAAERDESVLMAFQKCSGCHYIFWAEAGRWSASQKIEHVLTALLRLRPEALFTQRDMNSESFQMNLIARATEFGLIKIPTVFTDATNKAGAKNISIGNIENAMKGKRLKIYRKMPGYDTLVRQLLKFPNLGRLDHDDYADCCGQVVSAPTNYLTEPLPIVSRKGNHWLRDLNNPAEPESNGADGTGFCF